MELECDRRDQPLDGSATSSVPTLRVSGHPVHAEQRETGTFRYKWGKGLALHPTPIFLEGSEALRRMDMRILDGPRDHPLVLKTASQYRFPDLVA